MRSPDKTRPTDPFTLKGVLELLRNWYWVFVVFLGLGGILAFSLIDGFGKENLRNLKLTENKLEWRCYWVGEFTQNEELGILMLRRMEHLLGNKTPESMEKEVPLPTDRVDGVSLRAHGRFFSLRFELKDSISENKLRETADLFVKGGFLGSSISNSSDPKDSAFSSVSFDLLCSTGVTRLNKGLAKSEIDSRYKLRGYTVILILSIFLAYGVAILLNRFCPPEKGNEFL